MITLLLLGFVLSLDSFRVSLGLGATRLRPARRAQVVIAFGLCDALAPLAGELIGQSIMAGGAEWLEYLGPLMLCGYGAYVICVSRRRDGGAEPEESRWVVLGLPLALSLDNLIAGTSLGMLGFPPLLSAAVIVGISALMSLAGFLLGKTAIGLLKLESEMIGGVALVVIGLTLALGNLSGFVH